MCQESRMNLKCFSRTFKYNILHSSKTFKNIIMIENFFLIRNRYLYSRCKHQTLAYLSNSIGLNLHWLNNEGELKYTKVITNYSLLGLAFKVSINYKGYHSDDPSSNPAEAHTYFSVEAGVGPFFTKKQLRDIM